jgi:hypothetical protein
MFQKLWSALLAESKIFFGASPPLKAGFSALATSIELIFILVYLQPARASANSSGAAVAA